MQPKKNNKAVIAAVVVLAVLAVVALTLGIARPVWLVDQYWTVLIETGVVDPTADFYPWTVAVDWSPDSATVVSSGYHPDVLLWDTQTGRLKQRLMGHRIWVQEVIYSPDGQWIASVDWDGQVILWDAASGEQQQEWSTDRDLFTVAFHPTKPQLAAGSYQGSVAVFSLLDGEQKHSFVGDPKGVLYLAYSPDGRLLAVAGENKVINIVDADNYRFIKSLIGHEAGVTSLSFTRDGARLLSCGDDGTIRLWDVDASVEIKRWQTQSDWINFCVLLPDDKRFLTAGTDGKITLWSVEQDEPLAVAAEHADWAQCVRVSRDGRLFASGSKDGEIFIYDLAASRLLKRIDVSTAMRDFSSEE